jgi:hypothetical protein
MLYLIKLGRLLFHIHALELKNIDGTERNIGFLVMIA